MSKIFKCTFIGFNCLLKIDEILKNFVELRDVKNRDFYLMIMRFCQIIKYFQLSLLNQYLKNIIVKSISDVSNDNYYINILRELSKLWNS